MAHSGRMALQPHPTCDLFSRPATLQPIFYGILEFRVNDHFAMDSAPLTFQLGHSHPFSICIDFNHRGKVTFQRV